MGGSAIGAGLPEQPAQPEFDTGSSRLFEIRCRIDAGKLAGDARRADQRQAFARRGSEPDDLGLQLDQGGDVAGLGGCAQCQPVAAPPVVAQGGNHVRVVLKAAGIDLSKQTLLTISVTEDEIDGIGGENIAGAEVHNDDVIRTVEDLYDEATGLPR